MRAIRKIMDGYRHLHSHDALADLFSVEFGQTHSARTGRTPKHRANKQLVSSRTIEA